MSQQPYSLVKSLFELKFQFQNKPCVFQYKVANFLLIYFLYFQGLPLSLNTMSPAHTVNWDLVSDMVNAVSRVYRGPRQCKQRFDNIIAPREEGRILYDMPASGKFSFFLMKRAWQRQTTALVQVTPFNFLFGTSILYRLAVKNGKTLRIYLFGY